MFRNYLLIMIRNLGRQKSYSLINIIGLAIGMSCCLIILMLVGDELSYDRFHENADRIYRITLDAYVDDKAFQTVRSSSPVAEALRKELPQVEAATRFRGASGQGGTRNWSVRYGDHSFDEWLVFFTDSSFFDVFSCEVLKGDVNTFLTHPQTIVITDAMATKYFGDASPLGKTLILDGRLSFMVCGVVKRFPPQSHWRFEFLASSMTLPFDSEDSWINNSWNTYVLLKKGASRQQAEDAFQSVTKQHVQPQLQHMFNTNWQDMEAQGMRYLYRFQPLLDIHLRSHLDEEIFAQGNLTTVSSLVLIAIFIIVIACINFINLSTARSTRRAKEVGVRKVLGSQGHQLITLFLGEAILFALMAMIISMGLIELALPVVNDLMRKSLSLAQLPIPVLIFGPVVFAVLVGLMAGGYPAFVLSSYRPAKVLKGSLQSSMRSGRLRKVLVITQFVLSVTMMIGTLVVYRQLQFVQTRDLGFDKEQMLVVDNTWLLGERTNSFREILLSKPGILAGAYTQNLPGNDIASGAYRREGEGVTNLIMMQQLWCDYEYLATIGVRLEEGRPFSREYSSDPGHAVILNKQAARVLGYEHPVGRHIIGFFGQGERPLQIIGVSEDFHYEPLHLPIRPMVILLNTESPTRIVLKVQGDLATVMHEIRDLWDEFSGGQPFTSYFLDDRLNRYYLRDQATGNLMGLFAILGIFISCLGLLGLATYATEQRTKEIGIRKVLGATTPGIIGLLSQDFIKLILIANPIAWLTAWYFMNSWLQNFAYRTRLSWELFALASLLSVIVALVTVSGQTLKAAKRNPVKALRYE